jgi:hypothetical protein
MYGMHEESHAGNTLSALRGWKRKNKFLIKGIKQLFPGEKILVIKHEL